MADPEYLKALKLGEKAARAARLKGKSPYLPALDDILKGEHIAKEMDLGVIDIPLDQIVGTKTEGRQNAFAPNFMPLVEPGSEFAAKWANLYYYQTSEGVSDPIIAYEYMNRYYVLEGNKRVSVFRYLDAFSIEGHVTRIIPTMSEDPQVRIFYEYMDFYSRTEINYLRFSKIGSYAALTKATGHDPEEIWSENDRKDFSSAYLFFGSCYDTVKQPDSDVTTGDAMLFYLSLYSYEELKDLAAGELKKRLTQIKPELTVLNDKPEQALVTERNDSSESGLLNRFLRGLGAQTLKVAFIHEKKLEESGWTYSHELGRMHLEEVFGEDVRTTAYFMDVDGKNKETVIESAIEDGNRIIFTTSERLLEPSLHVALKYPDVRILNCSVNRPYRTLRTYYGRMHEAKYLSGMIAGAMCENDKIAYVADYPIYGTMASINAFALGAAATNPRAKIYLHWNCTPGGSLDDLCREHDIHIVSDIGMIRPGSNDRRYGLYKLEDGHRRNLAAPIWDWGMFYEKIIRDISSGNWNSTADTKTRKALNYWWGISGGIIDLILSGSLPAGLTGLVKLVKNEIYQEDFKPFTGVIRKQDGTSVGEEGTELSPEAVITMNWLCENVIGSIPKRSELTAEALSLVAAQGIEEPDSEVTK